MTTQEIISKALQILQQHDFYWQMVDYGYERAKNSAKANMRYYVETIKQLPEEIYNLMRELWKAEYEYCSCFSPCYTSPKAPEYKAQMEKLHAEVEALMVEENEMVLAA